MIRASSMLDSDAHGLRGDRLVVLQVVGSRQSLVVINGNLLSGQCAAENTEFAADESDHKLWQGYCNLEKTSEELPKHRSSS